MSKRTAVDKIMRRLGAKPRGQVHAGAGVWGAAELAAEVALRFKTPAGGGRSTEPTWSERRLVPLAPATLERLTSLAARVRRDRPGIALEPMQLAGLLLEQSTRHLTRKTVARLASVRGA